MDNIILKMGLGKITVIKNKEGDKAEFISSTMEKPVDIDIWLDLIIDEDYIAELCEA